MNYSYTLNLNECPCMKEKWSAPNVVTTTASDDEDEMCDVHLCPSCGEVVECAEYEDPGTFRVTKESLILALKGIIEAGENNMSFTAAEKAKTIISLLDGWKK